MKEHFDCFKNFLALAFASVMFAPNCFAVEPHTEGYYKTKMLCNSSEANHYLELGRVWYSSFSQDGIIPLLRNVIKEHKVGQFQLSAEFESIIDDPQHFEAIRECFGSDETQRKIFFWGLYAADLSAKLAAWAFDATLIRVVWFGGRAILAAGEAEMPQRFMWFRIITRLADRDRRLVTKFANLSIWAMFFSSMAADQWSDEKLKQQIQIDEAQGRNKTLSGLMDELATLQSLVATTTDPDQKGLLQTAIDNQTRLVERAKKLAHLPEPVI